MKHLLQLLFCLLMSIAALNAQIVEKRFIKNDTIIETPLGQFNERLGVYTTLYKPDFQLKGVELGVVATSYLASQSTSFKFKDKGLNDLKLVFTKALPFGTVFRYQQFLGEYPIENAQITISVDKKGQVIFVANDYKPDVVATSSMKATKTEAEADTQAKIYLNLPQDNRSVKQGLRWIYTDGVVRLTQKIVVLAGAEWHVYMDALEGTILEAVDKSLHCKGHAPSIYYNPAIHHTHEEHFGKVAALVTGTGNVFNPDPLSSAKATYGTTGFDDNNDGNSAQLTAQNVPKSFVVTQTGATFFLENTYAKIYEWEAPNRGIFSQNNNDWSVLRRAAAFEAVNAYYWVSESMKYINTTLGISVSPILTTVVQIDPHGENGADNSHFSSATDELIFGEGGVDDAEDTDVVTHELGHGLHSWLTGGNLSNTQGLSEGFGDYWAQSLSRSLGAWTSADAPYQWTFNWDGHNPNWNGRITNYTAVYPSGLVNQIHTDGQIFATCMMKVYDQLGRTKTDIMTLEGLTMLNASSNQNAAAVAILNAAAGNLPLSEAQQVYTILSGCGYAVTSLPITITQVAATIKAERKALISWQVASEVANETYFVQTLQAPNTWKTIGEVPGNQISENGGNYTFEIENLTGGNHQFRIVNKEGESTTPIQLWVELPEAASLDAPFPNPTQQQSTIRFQSEVENTYKLVLYNNLGQQIQVLFDAKVNAQSNQEVAINTHNLAAGTYFVRLMSPQKSWVQSLHVIK